MTKQCKACPWKKSTRPASDIPGGYEAEKHRALVRCQAPEDITAALAGPLRIMACHESTGRGEHPCVGWVVNQLGPGNNIALRLRARSGEFNDYRTVGPQHDTIEAMCDTAGKRR